MKNIGKQNDQMRVLCEESIGHNKYVELTSMMAEDSSK